MRDLEQSFVSEVSEDTAKTLHMLWWSAGGDPQEFPGGLDLSLDISESDIRQFLVYLFSQPPIGDPTLWQRLGTRVAAKTLLELHTLESSSNLSEFVVQNLNRLQFRCVAADRLEDRLPLDGPLAWELSQGHLVLRGRDFELAFALDGRHFNHRSGGSPLSPAEAVRRATGFSVDSIELDEERRLIGIRAKGVTDQGTTASLEELLQGETGSVTELTVRLQDGAPLRCVYERNAGFIDTDRNLPTLSLLAQGAVRLLLHLEPNDLANLLEYLRPRAVALGQGELGLEMPFDDRSD